MAFRVNILSIRERRKYRRGIHLSEGTHSCPTCGNSDEDLVHVLAYYRELKKMRFKLLVKYDGDNKLAEN